MPLFILFFRKKEMNQNRNELREFCSDFIKMLNMCTVESKMVKKFENFLQLQPITLKLKSPFEEETDYFINNFCVEVVRIIINTRTSSQAPPPFQTILIPLSNLFVKLILTADNDKFLEEMLFIYVNDHIPFFAYSYYNVLGLNSSNNEYFKECLKPLFENSFFQKIISIFSDIENMDLKKANFILRLVKILKYHKFNAKEFLDRITPNFIQYCSNLSVQKIRELDDRKLEENFKILMEIGYHYGYSAAFLSISIQVSLQLVASNILSKQLTAINFIKKMITSTIRNISMPTKQSTVTSICQTLKDQQFITKVYDSGLHYSLVPHFCTILSNMLTLNLVDISDLKNLWTISTNAIQSVQIIYFDAYEKLFYDIDPKMIQELLIFCCNNEELPEPALNVLTKEVPRAFSETKDACFEILLKRYQTMGDQRIELIKCICAFVPLSQQGKSKVQEICINKLKEHKDLNLVLPLLQATLISSYNSNKTSQVSSGEAHDLLNSICNCININDAVQYFPLLNKACNSISDQLNDNEYNRLLSITKPFIFNSRTACRIHSTLLKKSAISPKLMFTLLEILASSTTYEEYPKELHDQIKQFDKDIQSNTEDIKDNTTNQLVENMNEEEKQIQYNNNEKINSENIIQTNETNKNEEQTTQEKNSLETNQQNTNFNQEQATIPQESEKIEIPQKIPDYSFKLIQLAFQSLNPEINPLKCRFGFSFLEDPDKLIGIDLIWYILLKTGDENVYSFLKKLYDIDKEEKLVIFTTKLMSHVSENGGLKSLANLLNDYDDYIVSKDEKTEYIPSEDLFHVTLGGDIELDTYLPKSFTGKDIRRICKIKLGNKDFTICMGEDTMADNSPIFDNCFITVQKINSYYLDATSKYYNQSRDNSLDFQNEDEHPFQIIRKIIEKEQIYHQLLSILKNKDDLEKAKNAYNLLLKLKPPIDYNFEENTKEITNEFWLLYSLHIFAKQESTKFPNLLDIILENQYQFDINQEIPQDENNLTNSHMLIIHEDNLIFIFKILIKAAANDRVTFSQRTFDLTIDAVLHTKNKSILYSLLNLLNLFILRNYNISQEKLLEIIQNTLFNENTKIRKIVSVVCSNIKSIIQKSDDGKELDMFSILLSFIDSGMAISPFCDQYFELFTPFINSISEDELQNLFEKLQTILYERYTIPKSDGFLSSLQFKPPPLNFSRNYFKLILCLFQNHDKNLSHNEKEINEEDDPIFKQFETIFDFFVNDIIFNGIIYYEPSPEIFGIIEFIISKKNELGPKLIQKLLTIKGSMNGERPLPVDPCGKRGLKNLGATCYMNATIQQLFSIPEFTSTILSYTLDKNTWESEFQYLIAKLKYFPEKSINPMDFCKLWTDWGGEPINVREQQDAGEFISMLFDRLIDKFPNCMEIFQGIISNKIQGVQGGFQIEREEPFQQLQLEVKNHSSVDESLDTFLEPEIFEGKNQYSTDEGKIDAKSFHLIKKMPKILIIQLKRFEYNVETGQREKLNTEYRFPMHLDISKTTLQNSINSDGTNNAMYDLIGIEMHMGTSQSGHYFSYVFQDDKWYCLNDEQCSVYKGDVFTDCIGGQTTYKYYDQTTQTYRSQVIDQSSNAYILYYRQRSTKHKNLCDEISPCILERLIPEIKESLDRSAVQSPSFASLVLNATKYDPTGEFLFTYTMNQLSFNQCQPILIDRCISLCQRPDFAAKVLNEIDPTSLLSPSERKRNQIYRLISHAINVFTIADSSENGSPQIDQNVRNFITKLIITFETPQIIFDEWRYLSTFFIVCKRLSSIQTVDEEPNILKEKCFIFLTESCPTYAIQNEQFFEQSDLRNCISIAFSYCKSNIKNTKKCCLTLDLIYNLSRNYQNMLELSNFGQILSQSKEVMSQIKEQLIHLSGLYLANLYIIFINSTISQKVSQIIFERVEENRTKTELFAQTLSNIISMFPLELRDKLDLYQITKSLLISPYQSVRSSYIRIVESLYPLLSANNKQNDSQQDERGLSSLFVILISLITNVSGQCKSVEEEYIYQKSNYICSIDYYHLLSKIALTNSLQNQVTDMGDIFVIQMNELKNAPSLPNDSQMCLLDFLIDVVTPVRSQQFFSQGYFSTFINSLDLSKSFNMKPLYITKLLSFVPEDDQCLELLYKSYIFQQIIMFSFTKDARIYIKHHKITANLIKLIINLATYRTNGRRENIEFQQCVWQLLKRSPSAVDKFRKESIHIHLWNSIIKNSNNDFILYFMRQLSYFNKLFCIQHSGETKLFF